MWVVQFLLKPPFVDSCLLWQSRDIKFQIVIDRKMITWTLKNCLHAPDVPINLILVGALQENHMSIVFLFQKTTIAFPTLHPQLGGMSFDTHVV